MHYTNRYGRTQSGLFWTLRELSKEIMVGKAIIKAFKHIFRDKKAIYKYPDRILVEKVNKYIKANYKDVTTKLGYTEFRRIKDNYFSMTAESEEFIENHSFASDIMQVYSDALAVSLDHLYDMLENEELSGTSYKKYETLIERLQKYIDSIDRPDDVRSANSMPTINLNLSVPKGLQMVTSESQMLEIESKTIETLELETPNANDNANANAND